MTTSGQPAPGKKIALPSGAVWEGGPTKGTSLITLPDEDPILVADDDKGLPNSIVGRARPFGALARIFEEVLGHVPNFFADHVASEALNLLRGNTEPDDVETETRIVKISSKTTLLNPAKRRNRSGGENIVEEHRMYEDSATDDGVEPIRRARGGLVFGPGGPTEDRVLMLASPGEFVVNAAATNSDTLPILQAINAGWVPSARYLTGLLNEFGASGPVGDPAANPALWRDMLGQGGVADMLGGIGDAALNASRSAGAAVGSALAPMFRPGGPLASQPGSALGSVQSPSASTAPDAPLPLTASMQATPTGLLGALAGLRMPGLSTGPAETGSGELGSLSEALSSGVTGAATTAGSRVGSMLGQLLAPALGTAGDLAPLIGEQLGRLIGPEFGGSLQASMTLRSEVEPDGGSGSELSGGDVPGTTPSGVVDLQGNTYTPAIPQVGLCTYGSDPVSSLPTESLVSPGLQVVQTGSGITPNGEPAGEYPAGQQSLTPKRPLIYQDSDTIDRAAMVGTELAAPLGESGQQAAAKIASLIGAFGGPGVAAALEPGGPIANLLGWSADKTVDVPLMEKDKPQAFNLDPSSQLVAGVQGYLTGAANGGFVKGITGAIKGLASDAGSQFGGALGTAIGSMAGSLLATKAAELVTKPIEWGANTFKELVGTGFGLTDLAEGPGGHTARVDIYNFNGTDPKSASIATERVRRRRALAQQRGGGFGR